MRSDTMLCSTVETRPVFKTDTLTVLIADNQTFTRTGVSAILSSYYNTLLSIDLAKNKGELIDKLEQAPPDVLILDFDLFDFNELEELAEIKKIAPCTGILVITNNQTPEDILKVLDYGIANYILKTCNENELSEAFNATINNRKYLSSQVLDILLAKKLSPVKSPSNFNRLTPAEMDIVKLITKSLTAKEIAIQKNLSYHTVITHRKNIFRKLAINSTSELVMYAIKAGLVDSTEYYI